MGRAKSSSGSVVEENPLIGVTKGATASSKGRALPAIQLPTPNDRLGRGDARIHAASAIIFDPFRGLVFPNAIREQRRRQGWESLLTLAGSLPNIPYIRLSKIERGEVFAKASELIAIAAALDVEAESLLVDVAAPDYTISRWAGLRGEAVRVDPEAEELAMLLAATFRARRSNAPELTLARLQSEYGLPAVIVSRIENAAKTLDKWNTQTLHAVSAVLGIAGARDLPRYLRDQHASGTLDAWLVRIPGAADREARTRARVAALRGELKNPSPVMPEPKPSPHVPPDNAQKQQTNVARRLILCGTPVADGLIDPRISPKDGSADHVTAGLDATAEYVAAPAGAGPNAYALRMCRPSLGGAIPGHAVLIVDPDRFPVHGGLAVLTEGEMRRVVTLTTDREGRLTGHSLNPEKCLPLDDIPPADIAMVTAVLLG